MTNEEARNILLTSVHPQTSEEAEAIGVAVKAVERMIPKKPNEAVYSPMPSPFWCSACGEMVADQGWDTETGKPYFEKYDENFCSNCGQAIDWGKYYGKEQKET